MRRRETISSRCAQNSAYGAPFDAGALDADGGALSEKSKDEVRQVEERVFAQVRAGLGRSSADPSVYTGGPGVAYLFVKAAVLRGDKSLLSEAARLLSKWERATAREAAQQPDVSCSLLCGQAGWLCIEALRAHAAGDGVAARKAAAAYVGLATLARSRRVEADEWLYGRAGYLHGCLLLRHVLGAALVPGHELAALAETIVSNGSAFARRSRTGSPLMWAWYGEMYLGAAHGVFGILHMLLHVDEIVQSSASRQLIASTLDWLLSIRTANGNWPAVYGDREDHLVHFCHGAPGAILALCKAYQVLEHGQYLEAAAAAGELVWQYGLLKKGPGLCHGIAGNGYAFLALFRATKSPEWLYRAYHFGVAILRDDILRVSRTPDNPISLYEGLAGSACYLLDLRLAPASAAFPLFEVGGIGCALAEASPEAAVAPAAPSDGRRKRPGDSDEAERQERKH